VPGRRDVHLYNVRSWNTYFLKALIALPEYRKCFTACVHVSLDDYWETRELRLLSKRGALGQGALQGVLERRN